MTTLGKVLLGVGAALGLATVVYVTKKKDYTTVPTDTEEKKEEKSLKERIKEAAKKKAADILNWTITHMTEIQAASALIGLVSGVACLALRTKKLYSHDMELEMLKDIRDKTYDVGFNDAFDATLREITFSAKNSVPFIMQESDGTVCGSFNVSLA